jgi:hypothetical protein
MCLVYGHMFAVDRCFGALDTLEVTGTGGVRNSSAVNPNVIFFLFFLDPVPDCL